MFALGLVSTILMSRMILKFATTKIEKDVQEELSPNQQNIKNSLQYTNLRNRSQKLE